MSAPAFELEDVRKGFPMGTGTLPVLRGVSFRVAAGESVAIMGPSGSGKSTLLSILGCLELPSSGSLRILGQDASALSDDQLSALRARTMGFVFQAFHLLPAYDALANVRLASVYASGPDDMSRARELLTSLGLESRLRHLPAMLSGGEKQRVAIARALVNGPGILLADEPTGSLDQKSGAEILGLLVRLQRQGKTLVVVTHDPGVAAKMERIIEIVDGAVRRERSGRGFSP